MSVLHVAEVGKTIQYFPNPQPPSQPAANPVSLTGATVTMKVQRPDTGSVRSVNMTVSGDGTNAIYLTVADDFPVAGNYVLQWCASFPGGMILKSDQISVQVGTSF